MVHAQRTPLSEHVHEPPGTYTRCSISVLPQTWWSPAVVGWKLVLYQQIFYSRESTRINQNYLLQYWLRSFVVSLWLWHLYKQFQMISITKRNRIYFTISSAKCRYFIKELRYRTDFCLSIIAVTAAVGKLSWCSATSVEVWNFFWGRKTFLEIITFTHSLLSCTYLQITGFEKHPLITVFEAIWWSQDLKKSFNLRFCWRILWLQDLRADPRIVRFEENLQM